jgi:hypothetical protein
LRIENPVLVGKKTEVSRIGTPEGRRPILVAAERAILE